MKVVFSLCVVSVLSVWCVSALAEVSVTGNLAEIESLFEERIRDGREDQSKPIDTIGLRGWAEGRLQVESVEVMGVIEFSGKELPELVTSVLEAEKKVMGALSAFPEVDELKFAKHFTDFSQRLDFEEVKSVIYRKPVSMKLNSYERAEEILVELSEVEGMFVTDYRIRYEKPLEVLKKVRLQVWDSLARQKLEYEDHLGLELKLAGFSPFGSPERGGAGDDEVFELSPFTVSSRRNFGWRFKSRAEDVEVSHAFSEKVISQYLEARYDVYVKE